MQPPVTLIPAIKKPPKPSRVNVLHVCSNPYDRGCLRSIFDKTNWSLRQVSDCQEAASLLNSEGPFSVILCGRAIPAAEWQDLHASLATSCARPPYFIISALVGEDEEWAEAFILGADDVVAVPLDQQEVCWLISEAHKSWLASGGAQERALATVA